MNMDRNEEGKLILNLNEYDTQELEETGYVVNDDLGIITACVDDHYYVASIIHFDEINLNCKK